MPRLDGGSAKIVDMMRWIKEKTPLQIRTVDADNQTPDGITYTGIMLAADGDYFDCEGIGRWKGEDYSFEWDEIESIDEIEG